MFSFINYDNENIYKYGFFVLIMVEDYYKILGISRNATEQDIKTAYRKLAFQYHPDHNPNNKTTEQKFKELAEAYSVLGKADTRERYNRFGHPNSSIDDAVRHAWDNFYSSKNGFSNKNYGAFYEDFIKNVYSKWQPESAWEAAFDSEGRAMRHPRTQRYFDIACLTTISLTALGAAHGYLHGLDVAPFNWVWPESEIESYRRAVESGSESIKDTSAYIGGVTLLVPSTAIFGFMLIVNSIKGAIKGYMGFNNQKSKIRKR